MIGELIRMVSRKGFAFIKGEDKIEYFLHRDDFNGHWRDLAQDFDYYDNGLIQLEFTPNQGPKGPRASDVKRLDYPNQAG